MLEVKNLCVYAQFARGEDVIVKDVSFCVPCGRSLAIVGKSGAGKSMIAAAITGTLADNCFASGSITLDGNDLTDKKVLKASLGKDLVYIPQGGAESLNPSLKVKTQIYEAFDISLPKMNRDQKRAYAVYNLAKVCLDEGILDKYSFEISGGEAQRVMMAIALCANPKAVILDEPTRGLDDNNKQIFIDCLHQNFANSAIVAITHDKAVADLCDDVINVQNGVMVDIGDDDREEEEI